MTDLIGSDAKLVWAKDENGEIGRIPKDDPNVVWIERIPRYAPAKRGKK